MKKILFTILLLFIVMTNTKASEINEMTKYYKTVEYNNSYITKEISEKEYNKASDIELMSTTTNTEYKMMKISQTGNIIDLFVEWKKSPKYKSYDVIALMGNGISFNSSSIKGIQATTTNGVPNEIYYSVNSNNTKILNNGIGISMNLKDDAINHELTLTIAFTKTSANATIYGNYRHATKNVTLADSKNYTLSNGYINFNNNIGNSYDSITPVSISC